MYSVSKDTFILNGEEIKLHRKRSENTAYCGQKEKYPRHIFGPLNPIELQKRFNVTNIHITNCFFFTCKDCEDDPMYQLANTDLE